jgi:hypothetical protein
LCRGGAGARGVGLRLEVALVPHAHGDAVSGHAASKRGSPQLG